MPQSTFAEYRGLFIVFEGIDCCGKDTQAKYLKDYLQKLGRKAVISPEPTNSTVGLFIREQLRNPTIDRSSSFVFDSTMAYLFAADRHHHLYNTHNGILTLLAQKTSAIVPRYLFSSLAYNHTGDSEEGYKLVKRLNQSFPMPDLVIYLDIPVLCALKRLKMRSSNADIYEQQQRLLLARQNYDKIFDRYPVHWVRIDGCQKPEVISNIINQHIWNLLKTRARGVLGFPQHTQSKL